MDAAGLLKFLDFDEDNKITAEELWTQISNVFQDLAFEDALSYSNSQQWLKSMEIDNTQLNDKISKLFPEQKSTIGMKNIYAELD